MGKPRGLTSVLTPDTFTKRERHVMDVLLPPTAREVMSKIGGTQAYSTDCTQMRVSRMVFLFTEQHEERPSLGVRWFGRKGSLEKLNPIYAPSSTWPTAVTMRVHCCFSAANLRRPAAVSA